MLSQFIQQVRSKTAQQTSLLFAAQVGVILLGVITVPIISRTLGPDDYGKYALVLAVITFTASFFEFGFFSAGARLLAISKSEKEERGVLGSLYFVAAFIALFFAVTLWIVSFWIDGWLSSHIGPTLRMIAPLAAFFPIQFMIQQIAQGSNRIVRLAAAIILPGVWTLAAILILSKTGHITVFNVLTVNALGLILLTLFILTTFPAQWPGIRSNLKKLTKETRSYGRDVYLGRVIGGSMFDLDKFFISYFVSTASVGYYSLAILAVSPMVILSQSFATTLFKGLAQQDRVPAKAIVLNFLWLIGAAIFIILAGPWLIHFLFTDRFAPVSALLLPLAIAGVFQGLYQPYNYFLGAHGQGRYLRNSAFVFALFSVVFNYLLVKHFGTIGAAFATLVSNLSYLSLCLYCYQLYLNKNGSSSSRTTYSKEYFEQLYKGTSEPWGLDKRASQLVRYEQYLNLLEPYFNHKQKVLDIGCGKGYFTKTFANRVANVTCIDISEEAIRQGIPAKNIHYQVGSLPVLDFEDAVFDLALPLEVIYYLSTEEQKRALSEIDRILNKNGHVLFSVNIGPKPYFRVAEFTQLVETHFDILVAQPVYGRLYRFWEQKALTVETTPLGSIARTWLEWKTPVQFFNWLSRLIYGEKGITLLAVLARKR